MSSRRSEGTTSLPAEIGFSIPPYAIAANAIFSLSGRTFREWIDSGGAIDSSHFENWKTLRRIANKLIERRRLYLDVLEIALLHSLVAGADSSDAAFLMGLDFCDEAVQ